MKATFYQRHLTEWMVNGIK